MPRAELRISLKQVSREEIISRFIICRETKDNVQWEMGDLAVLTTNLYGSQELSSVSKEVGIEVNTIRRYRDVAKAYTPVIRNRFRILSWTSFREVAGKPNRVKLLKRAADEGWSVEKLRIMANPPLEGQPLIDDGLPVPPRPEMYFCLGCRKWYLKDEELLNCCVSKGQCLEVK